MTMKNITAKAAAAVALTSVACASANAQTLNVDGPSMHSLRAAPGGISNRTLLLASAIILLVGLADSDSTLTIIGGVGVLISVMDTNTMSYRMNSYRHDLIRTGGLSFGMAPYGQPGSTAFRPAPYAQISIKF
jgi:hypothetical protein